MKPFLVIVLLAACAFAQQARPHTYSTEKKVALEWQFRDETRVWLSANYYGSEFEKEGYHPSYVYLMSQYKPEVKKLKNGQYVITFASEIATDIP